MSLLQKRCWSGGRANFRKSLCILDERNPRIGEPASALRTIFRFSWRDYEATALFGSSLIGLLAIVTMSLAQEVNRI